MTDDKVMLKAEDLDGYLTENDMRELNRLDEMFNETMKYFSPMNKEKIIEGADKKTFEPMEGKFSKDKFGFFYKEQRLEGVSYEDIKDLMKASRIDDKKVPGYKYKE